MRRLSFVVCRLKEVGSRQSAVGRRKVTCCKSQVASSVVFGDVIGYWLSVIGSVAKQRQPKSFTIHHSPFIIRERSFRFRFLIPHSSFLIKNLPILFILLLLFHTLLGASELKLSDTEANRIAQRIWLNEGSGQRRQLVWWNKGEEFASCGIGHFIWYTAERPMWFRESFPPMLRFLIAQGAKPPRWLTPRTHCIWKSYEEWKRAKEKRTKRMRELTDFLDHTKGLQARFMLQRLNQSYPKILAYAKAHGQGAIVERNYRRLLYRKDGHVDPQGAYILIDYINFKGDGIDKSERYQGKGWGLYQVLTRMDPRDPDPHHAFYVAAKKVLERLIRIAPPQRRLWRFKKGWFSRMETYLKP